MREQSPSPFEPALKKGAKIGVMSPSSYVERVDIEASTAVMEALGYEVFVHPQTYERLGQSAGNVLQKSLALQGLLMRDDIDVIWFAGGGNEALPLLESLNFQKIKASKPICGFSDNTSLLNAFADRVGGVHFHAQVFKNLHRMAAKDLDYMLGFMRGDIRTYSFDENAVLRGGEARGRLVGGNLSLVQYLPCLLSETYFDGSVLFLEDCNEELSKIDRMLAFLRASGVLARISGLLVGWFDALQDSGRPFGKDLNMMIAEHMQGYDVPIVVNLPFGHFVDSGFMALPVGVEISVNSDSAAMKW